MNEFYVLFSQLHIFKLQIWTGIYELWNANKHTHKHIYSFVRSLVRAFGRLCHCGSCRHVCLPDEHNGKKCTIKWETNNNTSYSVFEFMRIILTASKIDVCIPILLFLSREERKNRIIFLIKFRNFYTQKYPYNLFTKNNNDIRVWMPLKYLHWFTKFNFDVAKTTLIFLAECNGMAHEEHGMDRLTASPLPSSPPTLPPPPSPKPKTTNN